MMPFKLILYREHLLMKVLILYYIMKICRPCCGVLSMTSQEWMSWWRIAIMKQPCSCWGRIRWYPKNRSFVLSAVRTGLSLFLKRSIVWGLSALPLFLCWLLSRPEAIIGNISATIVGKLSKSRLRNSTLLLWKRKIEKTNSKKHRLKMTIPLKYSN